MINLNEKSTTKAAAQREREANIGGLCANCVHLPTCTYVDPVNDTWFCEEYVFEGAEEAGGQGPEALPVVNNPSSSRTGLCLNCELRDGCTFPQPPGGVWFCGEYR